MKKLVLIIIVSNFLFSDIETLSQRPFIDDPENYSYIRGTYLIILAESVLQSSLENSAANFIEFKKSQGIF